MSPTLLRLLAGLLVIVAAVLAVIGWRISQQPEPAPTVEAPLSPQAPETREPEEREAPGHAVVVAARDLALGQRLDPEAEPGALRVVAYPDPVPGSFAELEELADRRLTRPVPEGDILRPAHFNAGGVMAQAVPPGKRAIAVGVDEVIGSGGFLAPGDRVDVLYQAQAQERNAGGSQPQMARRLFENVQVVSYGESLQGVEEEEESSARRSGRTAVLAMDGEQAATLLLAETTGQLRLALIGAEEHRGLIEREAHAREGTSHAPDGALPIMAGLPGTNSQDDANETRPAAPLPSLGPAVLFDELTVLDDPAADEDEGEPSRRNARRQANGEEPTARRVIQHVGGEVRVVELP